ncbi:hypothetical protein EG328_009031 [Venturia inaequalis]|uniref:Thioredoxin n=1 Tax=Venturia inaequalis TaxID=5025 RepID=A0A8H3UAD2_VENIN|nr:hypothetical protein EG328_009031 [Venturia inaequalis]
MSKPVEILSPGQLKSLLFSSTGVVVDYWCGPCKQIAPIYEGLSTKYSRPNAVTFAKVNTDSQQAIAQQYNITAMPTFIYFENGKEHTRIKGVDTAKLNSLINRWTALTPLSENNGEGSSSGAWIGASLPRGYRDVTDQVDVRGLDILNIDSNFGTGRTLFDSAKPSSLGSGKAKATGSAAAGKDWVETDTDAQLMFFVPFTSTLKLHTVQITSLPPPADEDDDEAPVRPKTIHFYTNRAHNLGFEEAEDIPATQTVELSPSDWDEETGTAKIELRFVKFQNITSIVIFVVDGENDSEKTRIDRIKLIGESGEKREMGKLEKIGDDQD